MPHLRIHHPFARKHRQDYSDDIVGIVAHARHWMALDETRTLVVEYYNRHPVHLSPLGLWPNRHNPDNQSFQRWLRKKVSRHTRRPLMMPVLWRNHYTGLYIPNDRREPIRLFDAHHRGRLGYTPPPVSDIRAVFPNQRIETEPIRGPLQRTEHDVFCAVWTLWWFAVGYRQPRSQQRPTFATVFRFMQENAIRFSDNFFDYLTDSPPCPNLNSDEAHDVIRSLRMLQPKYFARAFSRPSESMWRV